MDGLKEICDLTLSLTKLKQNECSCLCIESFASGLLYKLLSAAALLPPVIKTEWSRDERWIYDPKEFKPDDSNASSLTSECEERDANEST